MNLARYEKMNINTVFNMVNMKLRDEFQNIDELCRYYNIEMEIFKRKLFDAGYKYNKKKKCFQPENK